MNLHTFLFQGFEAKRKVASFGYDWSFEKRILSKGKDIPSVFDSLINKVAMYLNIDRNQFAELLVTEYPIGSVINWHRDAPPFDIIAGISLASDCTFKLRPHDKSKQGRGSVISLPVRRRSLYLMQGPARSEWQHSITPVREIRYSITLRTLSHKK
jgi:alkylated DNA repair dioxygenase AlkB